MAGLLLAIPLPAADLCWELQDLEREAEIYEECELTEIEEIGKLEWELQLAQHEAATYVEPQQVTDARTALEQARNELPGANRRSKLSQDRLQAVTDELKALGSPDDLERTRDRKKTELADAKEAAKAARTARDELTPKEILKVDKLKAKVAAKVGADAVPRLVQDLKRILDPQERGEPGYELDRKVEEVKKLERDIADHGDPRNKKLKLMKEEIKLLRITISKLVNELDIANRVLARRRQAVRTELAAEQQESLQAVADAERELQTAETRYQRAVELSKRERELEAQVQTAQTEVDRAKRNVEQAERDLDTVLGGQTHPGEKVKGLSGELAARGTRLQKCQEDLAAAKSHMASLRRQLDAAGAEIEGKIGEASTAYRTARQAKRAGELEACRAALGRAWNALSAADALVGGTDCADGARTPEWQKRILRARTAIRRAACDERAFDERLISVPRVGGGTLEEAQAALDKVGLTGVPVPRGFPTDVVESVGKVRAQNPAPGERVLPGAVVELTLFTGSQEEETTALGDLPFNMRPRDDGDPGGSLDSGDPETTGADVDFVGAGAGEPIKALVSMSEVTPGERQ